MPIAFANPVGLPEVPLYRQVAVATGSRTVFVAGQVSWDADGRLVGAGDLAAQIVQCYCNVATALAEVGATFADVADLTMFVAGWTPDQMPLLVDGMARAADALGSVPVAPASLIGVAALDVPEHLVELKVTAVLA
ncbi:MULTISPECIES: RidA family protein [unclassified Nocardioides]|uniref:RidA family protein n=1 Tax=unclassified Nocardioides TaxID=2615069 RepID=UPI0030148FE5